LGVDPLNGTILPGNSQTINVSANGSVLPVGTYEGSIEISSNDPTNNLIEIPVHFSVLLESGIFDESSNPEVTWSTFPNPFHTTSVFDLQLKNESKVILTVYDISGKQMIQLVNKTLPAGNTKIIWNGKNEKQQMLPKGVYFYQLQVGAYLQTGKLLKY